MELIYLDYNATTPCDPRVIERMMPYFAEVYGNPANGLHRQGRLAAQAVDEAREQVAALISAQPGEIIFTSGATESNNLAILGLARMANRSERNGIITCAIEHKAVLLPCKKLAEEGFEVMILPVDSMGQVALDAIREAVTDRTLLISIQAANNEIGTLQPIRAIAEIAHEQGAMVHCDAAQAVGKISVDVAGWGVDLLSISAHKLYGPKGIGALFVRGGGRSIPIEPLYYGGGQERGLRPGTTNVPAVVGLGEACHLSTQSLPREATELARLRDLLETQLLAAIPELAINGNRDCRLPNTSSLVLPGIDADALLLNLPDVMLGTGSACTSGAVESSHVLHALGLERRHAQSTIRASLGRYVDESDVQYAAKSIAAAWGKLADA
jgi:cysteine desulfurase